MTGCSKHGLSLFTESRYAPIMAVRKRKSFSKQVEAATMDYAWRTLSCQE